MELGKNKASDFQTFCKEGKLLACASKKGCAGSASEGFEGRRVFLEMFMFCCFFRSVQWYMWCLKQTQVYVSAVGWGDVLHHKLGGISRCSS